jgi:hypothetical protein
MVYFKKYYDQESIHFRRLLVCIRINKSILNIADVLLFGGGYERSPYLVISLWTLLKASLSWGRADDHMQYVVTLIKEGRYER